MKLLFTKRAYARVGGSESLAYQFATRLAARGHDVRVICAQAFDDRRVFLDRGVEVVQVRPRGGFLGQVADASTLVDLMRTDVLEWYAEDRDLIHNIGREYLDSSLHVAESLASIDFDDSEPALVSGRVSTGPRFKSWKLAKDALFTVEKIHAEMRESIRMTRPSTRSASATGSGRTARRRMRSPRSGT